MRDEEFDQGEVFASGFKIMDKCRECGQRIDLNNKAKLSLTVLLLHGQVDLSVVVCHACAKNEDVWTSLGQSIARDVGDVVEHECECSAREETCRGRCSLN